MDFGLLDYVSNIIDCLKQHISSLMNFHRLDRVDELSTMERRCLTCREAAFHVEAKLCMWIEFELPIRTTARGVLYAGCGTRGSARRLLCAECCTRGVR